MTAAPTGAWPTADEQPWVTVVPVKGLAAAKSRLDPGVGVRRPALARAFAVDTVVAIAQVPVVRLVVVVTADEPVRDAVRGAVRASAAASAVQLLDEPGAGGLNAAASVGIDWVRTHHPDAAVAIVPADLPALRTSDASLMLRLASGHPRAVVADREGTGTTVLTALPGVPLTPCFGDESLRRHRADGAVAVGGPELVRATRDVDTAGHLAEAVALGVGRETARVLAR